MVSWKKITYLLLIDHMSECRKIEICYEQVALLGTSAWCWNPRITVHILYRDLVVKIVDKVRHIAQSTVFSLSCFFSECWISSLARFATLFVKQFQVRPLGKRTFVKCEIWVSKLYICQLPGFLGCGCGGVFAGCYEVQKVHKVLTLHKGLPLYPVFSIKSPEVNDFCNFPNPAGQFGGLFPCTALSYSSWLRIGVVSVTYPILVITSSMFVPLLPIIALAKWNSINSSCLLYRNLFLSVRQASLWNKSKSGLCYNLGRLFSVHCD